MQKCKSYNHQSPRRKWLRFVVPCLLPFIALSESLSATPLKIGEKFIYDIDVGGVYSGTATMEVAGRTQRSGVDCLVLRSTAESAAWISAFFPVKDVITSHWDPVRRRTMWNEKNLREGNYFRFYRVAFDYAVGQAHWYEKRYSGNRPRGKTGGPQRQAVWEERSGTTWMLPDQFQDMLSAVYFARTHSEQARAGQSFILDVYDELKLTELKMHIHQKEELTLEVNETERTISAWRIQPFLNTTGMFQRAKGDVIVWISADENRWPLKVSAAVPLVGSVDVTLTQYIAGH